MHRRDFLSAMLAASIAPAFVPVSRLMKVAPIVLPPRKPLVDLSSPAVIRFYDAGGLTLADVPFMCISASEGVITLRPNGEGYVQNTGTLAFWEIKRSDGSRILRSNEQILNTNLLNTGSTLHFYGDTEIRLS